MELAERTRAVRTAHMMLAQTMRSPDAMKGVVIETREASPSIFPTLYLAHVLSGIEGSSRVLSEHAKLFEDALPPHMLAAHRWNYLPKYGSNIQPTYPDDIDDASIGLRMLINMYGTDSPTTVDHIDHYRRMITMTDTGNGGPFNTWIIPEHDRASAWQDIDIVVQAHTLSCLNMIGDSATGAVAYIDACIEHHHFTSLYYDSLPSVLYAISSSYRGSLRALLLSEIIDLATNTIDRSPPSAFEAARMLSSIMRLETHHEIIHRLYARIIMHRSEWILPYPFYIESIQHGHKRHIGSTAITAATIVEALELYEDAYPNNI